LILHGHLYGYGEEAKAGKIKRGHRMLCTNRRNRKKRGCGHTLCVLFCGFVKNHIISANSIWKFLNSIRGDLSLAEALRQSGSSIQETAIYRIFRKFRDRQVNIRTLLIGIKGPPELKDIKDPFIQTIEHLKAAFTGDLNPVSAFQHHFQASFL
jgi:hypothetical protein